VDRGERSSTRTCSCPVARHRSRRRRRGSTSPSVTSACAEDLDLHAQRYSICMQSDFLGGDGPRVPRVSTLFGAQAGTLVNKIDTINPSRSIIRCHISPLEFLVEPCEPVVADRAFVRAAAGLLVRGGPRAVELVGDRAPLGVVLHFRSATLRDDRAGRPYSVFGFSDERCDLAQRSS
jgi:hypothetical protein